MDANTTLRASPVPEAFLTPAVNITEDFHFNKAIQHVRLRLTNFVVPMLAANDYASAKLCDLPDTNLLFIATEANLTLVKGNVGAGGIVAATGLDVSIGTTATTDTTLATTEINIVAEVEADAGTLTDVVQLHSLATTPVFLGIIESATNALYINVVADGGITVDDKVTFSGTLDLFYLNLENVTS